MFKYRVMVKVDLGKLSKSIGGLLDEVNDTMHGFGFDETAHLISEVETHTFTVPRAVTAIELAKISLEFETVIKAAHPAVIEVYITS